MPPRYYVASAQLEQHSNVTEKSDIQKLDGIAGNLLKSGKAVIAFVAPEWCIKGNPDDSEKRLFSRAQCITLIESLENRAREVGYTVIDSKKFQIDPEEVSKQENLDALFYIDDLVIHSSKKTDVKKTQFAIQTSLSSRMPADIANEHLVAINNRCRTAFRAYHKSSRPFEDTVTGATLSMKMVSVTNMRSTWYYNDTINLEGEGAAHTELFYLSAGKKDQAIGKLIVGTLLTGLGITAVVVGQQMNKHGESFVKRNAGFGLAWASIIPFGVGLPLGSVGLINTISPPVYQPPIDVLCVGEPMDRNPFLNSSDSSGDTAMGGERAKRISTSLTDRLFKALNTLQADRVAGVAPPTSVSPTDSSAPTVNDSQISVSPSNLSPPALEKAVIVIEEKSKTEAPSKSTGTPKPGSAIRPKREEK